MLKEKNLESSWMKLGKKFSNELRFMYEDDRPVIELLEKDSPRISLDFEKTKPKKVSKSQIFSKALGLHFKPKTLLDLTAGWCQDSLFIMSCDKDIKITALERNKVVFHMIQNAWKQEGVKKKPWNKRVYQNLKILNKESCKYLKTTKKRYDVVYLDPMFLSDKKSLSSKYMRCLDTLTNQDKQINARLLLEESLKIATKRVVMKRPLKSPIFVDLKPSLQMKGKSIRYDIYFVSRSNK